MVVASPLIEEKGRHRNVEIPVIDYSKKRKHMIPTMIKSCEELGFFKLINHGVPTELIGKMETTGIDFFAMSSSEKEKFGPANPLGYGSKTIGCNGDSGEVEYLLLPANPKPIARTTFGKQPYKFRYVKNNYVEEIRGLTCEVLDMLAEGLGIGETKAFSKLIKDKESDSLLRLNYYPPNHPNTNAITNVSVQSGGKEHIGTRVGFGEHSDPQILTLLWSNDVAGFQILSTSRDNNGQAYWVSVPPDPSAFFVNVGDILQAMTNGRFNSVRHRAILANSYKPRLSLVYFAGPPLRARISPLPQLIMLCGTRRYKSFTWGEYKKAMYSLKLGHDRLHLFELDENDDDDDNNTMK